ncbi:hypothetical protein BCT96_005005 [Vibrio splendidus]|uniref:hypothetical protein n=1 Tax=Vibrio splendidus TaxID=29497 RepID=UPI000C84FC44|nr:MULTISPECIES: hypothetical protein [Vibrio]PMI83815.1 hypothetical protein BCU37_13535 [Vibrio splendidus]PMK55339.1 hypothetical protein BCT96_21230 [Vibrio splendidus]UPR37155.1 hypothetical protein ISX50_17975 [Vibrio cyclitrophicus]
MKSFYSFMKDEVRNELIAEASLIDVQTMFTEVDLEIIEPTEPSEIENKKQFRFTATTRKGTKIDMTMGISELLHPTFVIGLQKLQAS